MSKDKKSLVFFGNERLATGVSTTTPILKSLITSGYIPKLIVVSNATTKSRKNRKLEIVEVAADYNIPVLNTNNNDEIIEQINKTGASFAVLVAYGRIIPQSILDVFADGIINIHPSLLPKHRGPTPIESVILNGDTITGVSVIKLVAAMDAGPIYLQQEIKVLPGESKQELCDRLTKIGADLIAANIDKILSGEIETKDQDDSKATYDSKIIKDDGIIDWSENAEKLQRQITAYAEWPKSKAMLGAIEVIITQAHALHKNNQALKPGEIELESGSLIVQTGSGQLCIEKLKPLGKQEMSSSAFLAGYKDKIL